MKWCLILFWLLGASLSRAGIMPHHLLGTTLPATLQGAPAVTNVYDARDWLVQTLDPYQKTTTYSNDPADRLILVTDPVQHTASLVYDADGRQLSTANAANETNRQTWDARGLLLSQTDGAGHVILSSNDPAGNQVILTNRNGKPWQFYFDAANRLTGTVSPLGRSNSVAYNHQGLVSATTDQSNQPSYFYYDARGHLTSRTDNLATTTYGHDPNENLTSVTESGHSNVWTYDANNRVSTYQDINSNLVQYRCDANGNVTNLIYPGGHAVTNYYDALNRLTNVTDWAGRKTTLTYDLNSRLTGITRPNGTYRTISYDAAGETTNIWEQMANGLPIAWFRLNWTNSGSMAWEFAAPLPHTNTPPLRTMTYDADNRLSSVNGTNVTMDLDGNLTYGPLAVGYGLSAIGDFTNYTYDARHRLLNAGGATNTYDAVNNRISQSFGTNSTTYVVNPNAKLPQVLMRTKNGVTNYYIYGAGLLYQVTETASATNTLTYHYDYRGSTVALSGDNGVPTDRVEYSLYGSITWRAGTNDTPFLFNGRFGIQTDPNGLLYMRARYYNPYLCRFINPDPSGFKGGLNFYAYAGGNPVSYLDPFELNAQATGDSDNSTWLNAPLLGQPSNQNIGQTSPMQSLSLAANGLDYNPYMDQPNEPSSSALIVAGLGPLASGVAAAEAVPQTIGDILAGYHPDSMIHLTTTSEAELAYGVNEGSSFVRFGDVSQMTLSEYQEQVVGINAAGSSANVKAFVVVNPGAYQFIPAFEKGAAGVSESLSTWRFLAPSSYVPLPK